MKETKFSQSEIEIITAILEMEKKIDKSLLTIEDGKLLIEKASKCFEKTKELRKSRDSWRNKYEELKNES